jgi:hypothetical protein
MQNHTAEIPALLLLLLYQQALLLQTLPLTATPKHRLHCQHPQQNPLHLTLLLPTCALCVLAAVVQP